MAVLDLTLAGLKFPGLENYVVPFGTKKGDNIALTTEEGCDNLALPFAFQRPLTVTENSTTGAVQADRRVLFPSGGLTLTLGAAAFAGVKLTAVTGFTGGGSCTLAFNTADGVEQSVALPADTQVTVMGTADGYWHLYERVHGGCVQNLGARTDGSVAAAKNRYCVFDFSNASHRGLKFKAGTHIRLDIVNSQSVDSRWWDIDTDTTFDLNAMITAAAAASSTDPGTENGRNYYVYLVPDGTGGVGLTVSTQSTYPNDISGDYTANNTRKIAWFHTLCADAGAALTMTMAASPSSGIVAGDTYPVKNYDNDEDGFFSFYNRPVASVSAGTYYDVLTLAHPLAGFTAGQILPESVFCLTFRPEALTDGMVFDAGTGVAVDIYLQSGTGRNTGSEYGATITDTRQYDNHQDDMLQVRKRLLLDHEFSSAAIGSNQKTAISSNSTTTGGHTDTASVRMLSAIGCEDMCGLRWQWLADVAANGGSGWAVHDGQGAFGNTYGASYALLAGGARDSAAGCGSRCRDGVHARSNASGALGGRGASRLKCMA